ncbi:hypothetical protein C3941_04735 [Kaistia algarum]|uniref:zinc-binding metallopeptidase family protein n=1 Tax=Kaistia algarum TaxID=2083279 RepID=UPI000CE7DF7B|nr:putative zinc-binding metallopeptidase [Kaistia algarum]MCX5516013.1 putative zinc-binding metallopeptidase [Kaistia algarum]PPE80635.1 hypothetical protein C3941_04735 [Kaistia algarum]
MRLFECHACSHWLSFEEMQCAGCQRELGYVTDEAHLRSLDAVGQDVDGRPLYAAHPGSEPAFRFCANRAYNACNWLVPSESAEELCLSCRTNLTIPDLSSQLFAERWQHIEIAKHRLMYSLLRLGLAIPNKADDSIGGLSFQFLADMNDMRVMTGHEDGIITINIAEADSVERERARSSMHEPYRTLLGHFRHEIGHYYWDRLVRDGGHLDEFRSLFGDESFDYQAALQQYYAGNYPQDWRERFVSQYASAHPWEDFAETFAHFLHIVDTLETAYAFGLRIRPKRAAQQELAATIDFNPYGDVPIESILEAWKPLTVAVNSLNRSMGQPDLYPFEPGPGVLEKLAFIDRIVRGRDVQLQAA